jgi:hypothetical protein
VTEPRQHIPCKGPMEKQNNIEKEQQPNNKTLKKNNSLMLFAESNFCSDSCLGVMLVCRGLIDFVTSHLTL